MTSMTLAAAVQTFGVTVDDHHDTEALVPVLTGLQFQGDVAVVPAEQTASTPVPTAGVAVVRGENGGNTHLLLADGAVFFDQQEATVRDLTLGVLTVEPGATAYLAHPEHAYTGIGPGNYTIRRQREMAEELRMVAD